MRGEELKNEGCLDLGCLGHPVASLSRMDQYGGADMNAVTPRTSEEAEVVLVVHDEVVVHQNDGEDWSYQQVNVSHVLAVFPTDLCL